MLISHHVMFALNIKLNADAKMIAYIYDIKYRLPMYEQAFIMSIILYFSYVFIIVSHKHLPINGNKVMDNDLIDIDCNYKCL